MLNELKTTTQDTAKADIFVRLANEHYPAEADKSITKAELALMMMQNKRETRRIFAALDILIRCHINVKYNLDAAAKYLAKIQSLDKNDLTRYEIGKMYGLEGKVYSSLNDYSKAQKSLLQQLELFESIPDRVPKVDIANAYFDLGLLYNVQKDYSTAVLYFSKALDIFQQGNDVQGRVQTLDALSFTYSKMQQFDKSLQYSTDALFLSESIWDKSLVGNVSINAGISLNGVGKKEEAIVQLEKAIEIGQYLNNQQLVTKAKLQLGHLYEGTEKDKVSIILYREALDAALATQNKTLTRDVYEKLYEYYTKKDDTQSAFLYLQNLVAARDSLNIEEQSKQFIINKIRFEAEKKEQENQRLVAKQLESQVTIQRQKIGNYLLFALLLIAGSAGYFLYKSGKQKKIYNTVLEQEVVKRTTMLQASNEELITSNKQLEQSNNELERFAYIASHDLKSPLRNIISFLNLIQRKLRGNDDTDLQEYLRFATENAKQMHVLIQDVLEFSKVESTVDTRQEKVDLNESMMLVVQNLQESIRESNAEIVSESLPVIDGNSVHILQLLTNLVGNGIKYNKHRQPLVEITHNRVNGHHLFAVQDNGIGIAAEYHEQIFEMFKRLHTRDEYKGTGIGLAICKKIIHNFGGRIWLESDAGRGSTFYFTLPATS